MGPALAKKAYDASDLEVALLTSGQSLGLILSFFTAHLAGSFRRVPLVFCLQLAGNLALCPLLFVSPSFALGFVVLHTLARVAWSMSIPAQVLVYQGNFPASVRGRLVGRVRQLQLYLTTVVALLLSVLLDWSGRSEELLRLLGPCPVGRDMVRYVVPALAACGLVGNMVYRAVPERSGRHPDRGLGAPLGSGSAVSTLRSYWRVWRTDRAFRRYESFFFLFGFANIMTIPLTQIHAVDNLHASYFDLAMVNVVLVQGVMGLSMVWWGRRVDLHSPVVLRGVLNLVFSVDLLCLGLGPTIGWVFFGRVFRGLALGGGTLLWMLGPLWFARAKGEEAVYTGIHSVLTGLRWATAPFVGIALQETIGSGARPVFLVAGGLLVLTGLGLLREARTDRGGGGQGRDAEAIQIT
jgi:hypothetical protein